MQRPRSTTLSVAGLQSARFNVCVSPRLRMPFLLRSGPRVEMATRTRPFQRQHKMQGTKSMNVPMSAIENAKGKHNVAPEAARRSLYCAASWPAGCSARSRQQFVQSIRLQTSACQAFVRRVFPVFAENLRSRSAQAFSKTMVQSTRSTETPGAIKAHISF